MKPMLAANADLNNLSFPYYGSPKLDGVRAMVVDGRLVSRALKPITNEHAQKLFGDARYEGYDGELIVGDPCAKDVFRTTSGSVNRVSFKPDVVFYVFDLWNHRGNLTARLDDLYARKLQESFCRVEQLVIRTQDELDSYEAKALELGFEGVMLRKPGGLYKFGRSTAREGGMLKVKRFADSEAEILEVIEGQHNGNEAKKNLLGRTERSSHKENLLPLGTMGSLRVRDVHSNEEFNLGGGFTQADRDMYWTNRDKVIGMLVKYKHFAVGVKDKPRFPVYLGVRDRNDLS